MIVLHGPTVDPPSMNLICFGTNLYFCVALWQRARCLLCLLSRKYCCFSLDVWCDRSICVSAGEK